MTEAEWVTLQSVTTIEMRDHVSQFVSPISRELSDEHGELWGSGSYIESEAKRCIVTNEHVANAQASAGLTHQFRDSETIRRITNPFLTLPHPVDSAIARIDNAAWDLDNHTGAAIPLSRFAQQHNTVKGELLFMLGFSGERSDFIFQTLITPATPYTTQEQELPEGETTEFHFGLHYLPEKAQTVDGSARGLPIPKGFSGSLVWNTRRVECMQEGKPWTPEQAQVTGMLCRWLPDAGCLVATRVEHLLDLFRRPE
ncbi:hypothetical protein [Ralstonia sp.]|uniref:hypothetical protein n=1 Tax=Ralstonia sp. TaxID=54061 RepID=UPI0031DC453C